MVTAIIKGMTTEQATATVSTTALTAAQKAAALATAGMSEADIVATLVKEGWCESEKEALGLLELDEFAKLKDAASTDILTVAWLKLKAAGKGVLTTIQAHPILVTLAATAAAIGIVIAAYKKVNPSTETLAKNLDESKQKIQESTQKIEEMESELEQVQSRMSELKGMDSLSVVEKKELETLEQTNAQLERSIELEKQKRRVASKKATTDLVKWFDKDLHSGLEFNYSYHSPSILFKTKQKIFPNLAKKEISKENLSFVRFALEKAKEKKYNTVEYE